MFIYQTDIITSTNLNIKFMRRDVKYTRKKNVYHMWPLSGWIDLELSVLNWSDSVSMSLHVVMVL